MAPTAQEPAKLNRTATIKGIYSQPGRLRDVGAMPKVTIAKLLNGKVFGFNKPGRDGNHPNDLEWILSGPVLCRELAALDITKPISGNWSDHSEYNATNKAWGRLGKDAIAELERLSPDGPDQARQWVDLTGQWPPPPSASFAGTNGGRNGVVPPRLALEGLADGLNEESASGSNFIHPDTPHILDRRRSFAPATPGNTTYEAGAFEAGCTVYQVSGNFIAGTAAPAQEQQVEEMLDLQRQTMGGINDLRTRFRGLASQGQGLNNTLSAMQGDQQRQGDVLNGMRDEQQRQGNMLGHVQTGQEDAQRTLNGMRDEQQRQGTMLGNVQTGQEDAQRTVSGMRDEQQHQGTMLGRVQTGQEDAQRTLTDMHSSQQGTRESQQRVEDAVNVMNQNQLDMQRNLPRDVASEVTHQANTGSLLEAEAARWVAAANLGPEDGCADPPPAEAEDGIGGGGGGEGGGAAAASAVSTGVDAVDGMLRDMGLEEGFTPMDDVTGAWDNEHHGGRDTKMSPPKDEEEYNDDDGEEKKEEPAIEKEEDQKMPAVNLDGEDDDQKMPAVNLDGEDDEQETLAAAREEEEDEAQETAPAPSPARLTAPPPPAAAANSAGKQAIHLQRQKELAEEEKKREENMAKLRSACGDKSYYTRRDYKKAGIEM